MRLRDIQERLHQHADALSLKLTDLGGHRTDIVGRDRTERALRALEPIGFFTHDVTRLLDHAIFNAESSVLLSPEATGLLDTLNRLRSRAATVRDFLDSSLPPAPSDYLGVKLPLSEPTTDEAAKLLHRLHIALDQPVRRLGHSPLRLHLDVGSLWIEVAAGTTAALTLIGGLLGVAIALSKAQQERERTKQAVAQTEQERLKLDQEHIKLKQEELKAEQERHKLEVSRLHFEATAAESRFKIAGLATEMRIGEFCRAAAEPKETASVLNNAVTELSRLYAEGAEFGLQLNAPEHVRDAFPDEALQSTAPVRRMLPA